MTVSEFPVLLLATRNAGKAREFSMLTRGTGVVLRDLRSFPDLELPPEDGATYFENARTKALAVAHATGLPALADDSGLEVDALDGAPGVCSARFAGADASDEQRVALLLERLRGVPEEQRTARFRCVIVVARADGATISAEGTCEGRLTFEPQGYNGFGYDPIFFFPPAGRTFAQLDSETKNAVSHRARAMENLRPRLLHFLHAQPSP